MYFNLILCDSRLVHIDCKCSLVSSIGIPDVKARHKRNFTFLGLSSKMVYFLWAIFGGFILHFLLSNYLTVLLRPSYEKPVDTSNDLLDRDITPFIHPSGGFFKQALANNPDPNIQEISRRLIVTKNWSEFEEMVKKVISTGMFADLSPIPRVFSKKARDKEQELKDWYKSTETVSTLFSPFSPASILNKKWPLKKVNILLTNSLL